MGIGELETDGRSVWLDTPQGAAGSLRFRATNLRNERSGVHATVHVGFNTVELDYDNINVEKREERVRLANGCHRLLPLPIQDIITKDNLATLLGQFCKQCWPTLLAAQRPTPLAGLVTIGPQAVYLVRPWIIKGGGSLLFGNPGDGKSYMAQLMGVSADSGVSTIWPVETITKVLLINLERSAESIARRLAVVNRILELNPTRPLLTLNARGKSLSDIYDLALHTVEQEEVELWYWIPSAAQVSAP